MVQIKQMASNFIRKEIHLELSNIRHNGRNKLMGDELKRIYLRCFHTKARQVNQDSIGPRPQAAGTEEWTVDHKVDYCNEISVPINAGKESVFLWHTVPHAAELESTRE